MDILGIPAVTTRAPGCCRQGLHSGPFSHRVHTQFTSRASSVPRSFVFLKKSLEGSVSAVNHCENRGSLSGWFKVN